MLTARSEGVVNNLLRQAGIPRRLAQGGAVHQAPVLDDQINLTQRADRLRHVAIDEKEVRLLSGGD